jgi:hypothetical protein
MRARPLLLVAVALAAANASAQPAPAPVVASLIAGSVNVSAIGDVAQATQAIAAQFTNLSAAAAVAQQSTFLASLSAGSSAANLSAAAAATTASLVLAVVSAAPGVVLSVASQSAALSALSAAASAPNNVSSSTVPSIMSALSAVATSAVANNPAALAQVLSVLSSLASSQAGSLAATLAALPLGAPPPAPASTSSPTIQTLVQIDPPGGSRLTTQLLTAPGSPSAFQPMPANLLPTSTPIITQFFSLAFDPHAASSTLNTTGMTRLAFSNLDGSPIEVANATTPIRFTLPRVPTGGRAACLFWDPAAGAYATHGCATVPNVAPAGHFVSFVANFITPDDASLALSWNISGPMVDDGSCSVSVLDCNVRAASAGGVSCPAVSSGQQPVLRVYSGPQCALVQPGNACGCSWSNVMQAFVGAGCVVDAGQTQCMCRHVRAPCCETRRRYSTRM